MGQRHSHGRTPGEKCKFFFSLYGGGSFFATFFLCGFSFLLRFSPYGVPFLPFGGLSATFFSIWGPFCYVFLVIVGLFHHVWAFLLLFFHVRGRPLLCLCGAFWACPTSLRKFLREPMGTCLIRNRYNLN